jgi:threonyl-tRNA synthetase
MGNKEEKLHNLRHTLAHLLAAAVGEIYKFDKIKLTLGPSIDNGFYYDIDFGDQKVADSDLKKIEERMRKILPKWTEFEHKEISKEEAISFFKNEYKVELINEIAERGEKITTYTCGGFTDLCRGGHLEHPAQEIDPMSFKLDRVAGAYWRGDEKNKMLTRIYGLAFETKEELEAYILQQEEARKRDHRKIGKELGLFVFSDLVGPGLPLYTFKGTVIRREIINYSNELQKNIGYQEVHTPNINKAELFKISGHYEKYKEDMMKVMSNYSKEEYFLKPMNCPQHTQIYASQPRTYKELPIRIADFANLYRDERPGELSGLTRLRCFCQDDGHAFCREDQIKNEFENVLGIVKTALATYKMNYKIRLSLWDPIKPEKYLGSADVWKKSQKVLEDILIENQIDYEKAVGEAAIYGPKMDLISKDSIGREWQISTIQLDFIMPERFGLKYIDSDGSQKTPVMVHRAIVGSPERFMGILIEHYAGNFPLWLSPVQVKVIPVRTSHNEYAKEVYELLKENNIRVELDDAEENLGGKVRDAKNNKLPYWIVIGDKEIEVNKVTLESRDLGQLGQMTKEELVEKLLEEIKNKK